MSLLDRSVIGTRPATDVTEIDVLVEEIAELRPLPPIAAQVLQIVEGETFSAHELAQAISSDPALTARVLRVANSAYYGFPRRITTVRDAVVLLGFRQVRSTLLAATAMRSLPAYASIEPTAFWQHSVTVGLLAGLLARCERVPQDEAFTAGVLHNVGRLALDQARPHEFRRSLETATSQQIPLHSAQRLLFGYSDAEVGAALARHWGFPSHLCDAIAHHAEPVAPLDDRPSLAAIVSRARAYAAERGLTDGVEVAPRRTSPRHVTQFQATMAAMSSADLPQVGRAGARLLEEDALDRLVAEQGGLDGILDRAEAFVEHAAASA